MKEKATHTQSDSQSDRHETDMASFLMFEFGRMGLGGKFGPPMCYFCGPIFPSVPPLTELTIPTRVTVGQTLNGAALAMLYAGW